MADAIAVCEASGTVAPTTSRYGRAIKVKAPPVLVSPSAEGEGDAERAAKKRKAVVVALQEAAEDRPPIRTPLQLLGLVAAGIADVAPPRPRISPSGDGHIRQAFGLQSQSGTAQWHSRALIVLQVYSSVFHVHTRTRCADLSELLFVDNMLVEAAARVEDFCVSNIML